MRRHWSSIHTSNALNDIGLQTVAYKHFIQNTMICEYSPKCLRRPWCGHFNASLPALFRDDAKAQVWVLSRSNFELYTLY